jgi:pimeloyl-ACP methyl ester carboxylesterase
LLLKHWVSAADEVLKIAVDEAVLHVRSAPGTHADSDALVLLHAAASSGAQWRGLQRVLGRRFRLLMPDLYGDGLSTATLPAQGKSILEREVVLVQATLAAAGGRAHLVGHSYGGLIALLATIAFPSSVRSLFLIEPIAFDLLRADGPSGNLQEMEHVQQECREASDRGAPERAAERFVDYWGNPGAYRSLSMPQRVVAASSMAKVALVWPAILEGNFEYGAISIPTTVLCGDSSPPPMQWLAHRLVERIEGAELVRLAGAGHHSPLSHPAEVARELRRHVSRSGH